MWYLLSLQFLSLADELYQESSSLQIMTKLLPVFQLLLYSGQLFVWLHLQRNKPFTTGIQTPAGCGVCICHFNIHKHRPALDSSGPADANVNDE